MIVLCYILYGLRELFVLKRQPKMNERIKVLRKALGLSQEAFGKRLGVTKAAISRIEHGYYEPTNQMILTICRMFYVNEDWLRTGNGGTDKIFLSQTADEEYLNYCVELADGKDEFFKNAIIAYSRLDDSSRQVIRNFMQTLIDMNGTT